MRALFILLAAVRAFSDDGSAYLSPAPPAQEAQPAVKPPSKESIERSLFWGGNNLMAHQWDNGSWGQNRHLMMGTPHTLYVNSAVTAIVLEALERRPGLKGGETSIKKGRQFLLANGTKDASDKAWWRDKEQMNNRPYALAYGLSWLLRQKGVDAMEQRVQGYLKLIDVQDKDGLRYVIDKEGHKVGSSSFQVALLLIAVCEAEKAGYAVPEGLKARLGGRITGDQRGYYAGSGWAWDTKEAAVGRLALIRLAQRAAGGKADLADAVELFRKNRAELRKHLSKSAPTHSGPHNWAPYYYLFGMRYAALALKQLPAEQAKPAAAEFAASLLETQENGGGWQDSASYAGRSYGTAFAMLALMDFADILQPK